MTWGESRLLKTLAIVAVVLAAAWVAMQLAWRRIGDSGPALPAGADVVDDPGTGGPEGGTVADTRGLAGPAGARTSSGGPARPAHGAGGTPVAYQEVAKIAHTPKAEDLPKLKQGAASANWRTRELAALGISKLGQSGDPEALVGLLKEDPSPAVRAAAADGLARVEHWDAGPALLDALDDPDVTVRAQANAALVKFFGADMGFRADDDPPRRRWAAQKMREWWPKFYQGHSSRSRKG